MPRGLSHRNRIASASTKKYPPVLSLSAETTLFAPPITAEPVTRPPTLPSPPTTRTKNDIRMWSNPMNGCTGTSGAISTPPSPARHVPTTKVADA